MKSSQSILAQFRQAATIALAFALLPVESAVAQASLEPLENLADFVVGFLTGTFARSVAIIAVAALGYMGLFGYLRWTIAGSIMAGIALIFGGATIVDAISGGV